MAVKQRDLIISINGNSLSEAVVDRGKTGCYESASAVIKGLIFYDSRFLIDRLFLFKYIQTAKKQKGTSSKVLASFF